MSTIDIQSYPYPFFAREGWPFIAISVIVFIALFLLDLFCLKTVVVGTTAANPKNRHRNTNRSFWRSYTLQKK